MEKLLSQEEIDALLRGIENGKVGTPSAPPTEPEVTRYDFLNQDRVIRGRMPTLEILNELFVRLLRNPLSLILRTTVDVIPQKIQLIRYGEFSRALSVPCSLHVFKLDPLRGHSVLALDAKLVFSFIDIFLGGTGKTTAPVEGRDFTAIESRLIQKVVTIIFNEMEKAWGTIHPVTAQYLRSEMNPQFASIVSPNDLVLTLAYGVESEQFSGMFTLCIPYSILEPIKAKLCSGYPTEKLERDRSWMEKLLGRLNSTEVEITVEFARALISAQKLLSLKAGEIFPLGKDVTEPLLAKVQGVPKFLGRAGIYGSNKAFQVEEKIKPS